MMLPLVDPLPSADQPTTGFAAPPAAWTPQAQALLIPELQELLERLHRELGPSRGELLAAREVRQRRFDRGACPGPLPADELPQARGEWRIAPLPSDLTQRRVEVVGPISDAHCVLGLLSRSSSGERADAALLDFEDSMKPSWPNVTAGLAHLVGAVDGTLSAAPRKAAHPVEHGARLDPDDRPLIMVRVRGLHLAESNVLIDGEPVSAGLFDLACAAYWTARALLDQSRTPKVCVPKVDHHLEARWWSRLLSRLEDELDLPSRSIKATFSIEALPAVFQMEEILYQARGHVAALAFEPEGRLFGDLQALREHPDRLVADRQRLTLDRSWIRESARRLVSVCHRRRALAILGHRASCADDASGAACELGVSLGFDGFRVSGDDAVGPALERFRREHPSDIASDDRSPGDRASGDAPAGALPEACGPRTLAGLRGNVRTAILFLRAWNEGLGAVTVNGARVDLATFEVSRALTWQWLRHGAALDDGEPVTPALLRRTFQEEEARLERELAANGAEAHEIESYRKARLDAETILTESEPRLWLATASEPAGLSVDRARARLRGDPIA